jgi:hypothetical protein
MRTVFSLLTACIVLGAAGVALSEPPVPASPPAPKSEVKKGPSPNDVICQEDATTGSMLVKRVCKTRKEWDAMTDASKQSLEDARRVKLKPE